ncbi:fimbrial protein [Serratia liquefaciens]|jgi:type 1 fimbria pilin|uniref:fimbrial protein n=1 Tax=Serratia liquefaciens TaxID=614 RepID=UPI00301D6426
MTMAKGMYCLFFCGVLSSPAQAVGDVDMLFHGTLIEPPPCTINGDKPIEVEFNEVITTRVGGTNYRLPVNYTLVCNGAPSYAMKMQVQGTGAAFDASVLKTNVTGLGVALHRVGEKVPINTWMNFTYPNSPKLWALPVKQSGITLSAGEFTAGATMQVEYQ